MLDSAHVKVLPTQSWVRVTPASAPPVYTATGTLLLMVELLPSSPALLSPQQYALPLRIWHEWLTPAAIVTDWGAATATGTRKFTPVAGLPACPELFKPQQ